VFFLIKSEVLEFLFFIKNLQIIMEELPKFYDIDKYNYFKSENFISNYTNENKEPIGKGL